jgi:hypothetical protein
MTATPRAKAADIIVLRSLSIRRLTELLDDSDKDEDSIGVTQYAFKNALDLVEEAEHLAGGDLISSPVIDSEGGVRITWRSGHRQVKLVCPSSRETPVYIYWASPEGNDLQNHNITAAVLAEKLTWLTSRAATATG